MPRFNFLIELMKSTLIRCFRRVLFGLAKILLLPTVLLLGLVPGSAIAATAPPPTISILTLDAALAGLLSTPVFTWRTDGRALQFEATASRGVSNPVDVYFGVLTPGGRVFSWSPASGAPNMQEGVFPCGQGVTATEISSAGLLGSSPQYTFSAGSQLGIYSVFFFLVPAGTDPRDPRSWIGANMSPLVITN